VRTQHSIHSNIQISKVYLNDYRTITTMMMGYKNKAKIKKILINITIVTFQS